MRLRESGGTFDKKQLRNVESFLRVILWLVTSLSPPVDCLHFSRHRMSAGGELEVIEIDR